MQSIGLQVTSCAASRKKCSILYRHRSGMGPSVWIGLDRAGDQWISPPTRG